jgi:hypothetical protein
MTFSVGRATGHKHPIGRATCRCLTVVGVAVLIGCETDLTGLCTAPICNDQLDAGNTTTDGGAELDAGAKDPDAGKNPDGGINHSDAGFNEVDGGNPDGGCIPESDEVFCAVLHDNCGPVAALDNCGVSRSVSSCGTCVVPQSCGGGGTPNVCGGIGCTPESDAAFCLSLQKDCGVVNGLDNCGVSRSANCGTCASPNTCGGGGVVNVCGCTPIFECPSPYNCGSIDDGCGGLLSCGTCSSPDTCGGGGVANVCGCTPISQCPSPDNCGSVNDGCGGLLSCGTCSSPNTCGGGGINNVCGCTRATACPSQDDCGVYPDGCGGTISCGTCPVGQTCGGGGVPNVCSSPACPAGRTCFSNSWQSLPNTGTTQVQFICLGTVSVTATGGTMCQLSSGDPIQVKVNGSTYVHYPGCDSNAGDNCMLDNATGAVVPAGSVFKDYLLNTSGSRLLCDAMGWTLANTVADKNPGTTARGVTVVETNPLVWGYNTALMNFETYVDCEP